MDALGTEFAAADLWKIFRKEFSMDISQVPQYRMAEENGVVTMNARLNWDGQERVLEGQGNGAD